MSKLTEMEEKIVDLQSLICKKEKERDCLEAELVDLIEGITEIEHELTKVQEQYSDLESKFEPTFSVHERNSYSLA